MWLTCNYRFSGEQKLWGADGSVIPRMISGNTNTRYIIGEKTSEMIAVDNSVRLAAFVGQNL